MKKITLLLVVICITAACGSKRKKSTADSTTVVKVHAVNADSLTAVVYESLNGIDTTTVKAMKDNFESSKATDVRPTILNYLLPKPMLSYIIKMLEDERAAGKVAHQKHITDGMRIYFVKEQKNSPISLLLVSTIDSTGSKDCMECTHHDYYGHWKSEKLYSSGISLKLIPQTPSTTGAELYHISGLPDDTRCDFSNPHYLHRSFAERMVMGFHDHALNTDAEWYPLDMLEDMNNDSNCDGIRIYLATHPANDPISDFSNKDAFVLTTTQKKGNIYQDYFDCQTTQPSFKKDAQKITFKHGKMHVLGAGRDNGELCPANCN